MELSFYENFVFAAIKYLEVHTVYLKTDFVFYSPCSLKVIISKIVGVRDITLCYVANFMEYFISSYIISYYC